MFSHDGLGLKVVCKLFSDCNFRMQFIGMMEAFSSSIVSGLKF